MDSGKLISNIVNLAIGLAILGALYYFWSNSKNEDKAGDLGPELEPKTPADLAKDKAAAELKTGKKVKTITSQQLKDLAFKIVQARGIFNDDETQIYQAFKAFPSKRDYQLVASVWSKMPDPHPFDLGATMGRSLDTYLAEFLNNAQQAKVFDIIKKKPDFVYY